MQPASEWDFSSREDEIRSEIPRRLAPLRPRLVMLFGSRAAGTAHADSDYDLLVVMDVVGSGSRSVPVRKLLRGLGVPFDVIVYTPDEWERARAHPQALAHQILEHGQVLDGSP